MTRIPLRWAAADPITAAIGGRPRRFFAAGGLAIAALAPAGQLPLPAVPTLLGSSPVQSVPALPAAPLAAGAVLKAVDNAGHPLTYAQFEVYRADQPDGVQKPFLAVPAVSSTGTVTVPLPQPSAIPDAGSNYFAVSTGHDATGAPYTGIDYFNITTAQPVATATISPNLFVQVPQVTNTGQLPVVSDPPPSGPCGFQPDVVQPPPPMFTVESRTMATVDGTVNVGVVYGAGSWGGNSGQADVRYTPYRAMGESLQSEWSRATQSSVVLGLDLHGETQTKYSLAGNAHFTLAESDTGTYAGQGGGVSVAGQRARALVVSATWQHESITFHCTNGDHSSETREVWKPHQWNPHISTSTPDFPTSNNTLAALQNQSAAVTYPMSADQWHWIVAGQSDTYDNGYGAAIGAGPADLSFTVESQTTDGYNDRTDIYSADDCGTTDTPMCFYWAVNDAAMTKCPYQMACGTDYYSAIYQSPPAVPVAPQPCSPYEPHGACD